MEIHPPHPVHSFRQFLLQLLTITVGILIALGLEGIAESRHHHRIVREVKSNLKIEIDGNNRSLEVGLQGVERTQKQLETMLSAMNQLHATQSPKPGDFNLDISITTLRVAAWNTAEGIGALSYMEFEEVQHYSTIYDLQQQFSVLQQRTLDALLDLESFGFLLQKNPKSISEAQTNDAERAINKALASLRMAYDIGKALGDQYAKAEEIEGSK